MNRINILDTNTANKIAAGEVVERPFSVVKELIENSIDANAKNITIEIEDGGQKKIKILDDGSGIHSEDIEVAFLPHATSKINRIEDIFSINTMGFRGEALPSIAAVSKIVMKSRVKDENYGREISIDGGHINYIKDTACNVGTSIEVKDLFYNVPARQKFLKSLQREGSAISDIINRIALANSDKAFTLINNDKKTSSTYGTGNLLDTIRCVYGKGIVENIIAFENYSDTISVHGYVGNAEISRGSRNNQSVFVNKRYIKNKLIGVAVENAFKSFLTINKYPFFIVFIDIFPEFLDVNVHPTKAEIKFRDERQIFKLVFDAVHRAIGDNLKKSYYDVFNENEIISEQKEENNDKDNIKESKIEIQLPIDLISTNQNVSLIEDNKDILVNEGMGLEKNKIANEVLDCDNKKITYSEKKFKEKEYVSNPLTYDNAFKNNKLEEIEKKPKFNELRVIGQYSNTYILCEGIDGLYIIDQHAAHEKILFEKYMENIKNRQVVAQILLTPQIIELTPDDYGYYLENSNIFTETGFNIENFGDNTINIREVPFLLGKPMVKDLFMEILDNIKNMGSGSTVEVKYDKIATLACKAAVKGNDNLSIEEMKNLIEDLRYINEPFTCPHGRPTIIKMTLNELEKKFKRIQ